ncbi:CRISPR-associated endonuclease Cas2 [Ochrobactrum teleogrylli]|uniref:CRISPR-associated endonuclease Cas2 n=1 Tax=Ochrobactrum teleogrylli TaxID=2479765 RepID=UPI00384DA2AA
MRYLVSYDLHNHRDYTRLHNELKRLGGAKILLSMWGIQSVLSVTQLRNHLQRFVDHDDTILVHLAPAAYTGWASYNLATPAGNWLNGSIHQNGMPTSQLGLANLFR